MTPHQTLDFDSCYRAVSARDTRFDGRFYTAVTSTGIYCRPVCPARTPARQNVRFYRHAASAEAAGFRPCRRCRPELSPGDPGWDVAADLVGRALRLIDDGVADEYGVAGLAGRLHVTERHLLRLFTSRLGAGPLAVARTRRLLLAKQLLTETSLPVTDVAFAAGFGSVRQFNATMKEAYGFAPSDLRKTSGPLTRPGGKPSGSPSRPDDSARSPLADGATDGTTGPRTRAAASSPRAHGAARATVQGTPAALTLRLHHRKPYDAGNLLGFLAARAVPGVEQATATMYRRAVPGGIITLTPADGHIDLSVTLDDTRHLARIVSRCRRLLDLDADPDAIADALRTTTLRPLVEARPGLRVPGAFDGFELAVRAVVGQQVSVAGARTLLGRITARTGSPAKPCDIIPPTTPDRDPETHESTGAGAEEPSTSDQGCTRSGGSGQRGAKAVPEVAGGQPYLLFPTAAQLAEADLSGLGMTGRRTETLRILAEKTAAGEIHLDGGADPAETAARLMEIPGIGPWTTGYIVMRALRDPDAWPSGDLVLRKAMKALDITEHDVERWRPWRAYAALYLWSSL
ncbi:DNA-3-methyladenine glycosylase 2 family protein [Sphaerisporangium album]|uniref:DNA-3-methyladenine glycosylase II n=1 Tax=Sphaerisporangium album TaxID=509200 RepID=A0A367FDD7_9ACTN|nr:AlkA N-terminal domain-containing protein [Sphaerisporangium album]RCG27852.1 DNA-3-methyladenine glycosylase 2 family protein [Sphaerisporangium album]